jgi:hypothetical protein
MVWNITCMADINISILIWLPIAPDPPTWTPWTPWTLFIHSYWDLLLLLPIDRVGKVPLTVSGLGGGDLRR